MKIKEALPGVFQKAYPVLDPRTEMLAAMSLLRFHEIDALPLSFGTSKRIRERQRAVYGFSSLARVLYLKPNLFAAFLKEPCEAASKPLASVGAGRSLSALLDTFAKTRFGFAKVEEGPDVGALASLSDVLGLYETGAIASKLVVRDVGSQVLSMPGDAILRKVLLVMFERRHRRIFIAGRNEFVSDREIIGHIFSPAILKTIVEDSEDVLGAPISAVEKISARQVDPDTPLEEAAKILKQERAGQCLTFDETVVTPWDLVMKPHNAKALLVKK